MCTVLLSFVMLLLLSAFSEGCNDSYTIHDLIRFGLLPFDFEYFDSVANNNSNNKIQALVEGTHFYRATLNAARSAVYKRLTSSIYSIKNTDFRKSS